MRSGTWSGAASLDNVRVTVNGTVRPVDSVTIQSGMRDGHPLTESGSWCVESTIEWADPADVTADAPHGFGASATPWLPKPGDSVLIETGDGATGQWFVQHRGVIDDNSGSFADGTATSKTVDMIDELAGVASIGALMAKMWPGSGSTIYREIGLMSTYIVDRMFRTAQRDVFGWYATPPRTWETLGSMPGQGSTWPEVGYLEHCQRKGGGGGPSWLKTSYGVAPVGYEATTTLIGSTNAPILTVAVNGGYTGSTTGAVRVCDSDGVGAFIGHETTGDLITYGTYTAGGDIHWSVSRGSATRAALYFNRLTSSTQTLILRLNDGREFTQTATRTDYPGGWAADRVLVDSSTGLGWWMVEGIKPFASRWATLNHVPTARIRIGDIPWWKASRGLSPYDQSEFLQEQVDAECSAMWLDEDGVMQWAGRGVLEDQSAAQTVTSVRDIDDIQWEQRRRHLAKSVLVTSEDARIDMGYQGQVTRDLWSSDRVDLGPGEVDIIPVSVPADQDWLGVDTSPHHVSSYGHGYAYYRVGSTYGATQYRASDSEDQAWAAFMDCTMSRGSLRDYTVEVGAWASMTGTHRIKTTMPTTTTAFVRSGGTALNLRGRARLIWVDREKTKAAGSKGLTQYVHDVGWRVQTVGSGSGFDGISDLLTFIAAAMSDSTKPRITGVTMAHDPRRQIGDKIRIQDTAITGLDFDQLVQQRTIRVDASAFTDTISGRVTLVRSTPAPGSRPTPAGHTAMTPASNWTRSVA